MKMRQFHNTQGPYILKNFVILISVLALVKSLCIWLKTIFALPEFLISPIRVQELHTGFEGYGILYIMKETFSSSSSAAAC